MIPSKYLFSVIALVLVWATSLFGIYNVAVNNSHQEGIHEQRAQTYSQLFATLDALAESNRLRFYNMLREDASGKYDPILPVIDQTNELLLKYRKHIAGIKAKTEHANFQPQEAEQQLSQSLALLEDVMAQTKLIKRNLFDKHKEQFDLNPEDVEHYFYDPSVFKEVLLTFSSAKPGNVQEFTDLLTLVELYLTQSIYKQQDDLITISDTFTLICDFGPNLIPLPTSTALQQNQATPVNFKMWQRPEVSIENIQLVIRGDTLTAANNGYFETYLSASGTGYHTETITSIERNPITGLSSSWEFEYYFEVLPEK